MIVLRFFLVIGVSILGFLGTTKYTEKSGNQISVAYSPSYFTTDTTQLFVTSGDPSKDTVLIVGEGGPKFSLDFEASGRVYWEYLSNNKNYHYAVLHQSSTYNKSIFNASDFDLQDAYAEVDNSSEIMYRAIKYYKDRGKYVVVFGHSYSAWIIPHYLATRPSLADKYVITGGRLNADPVQTAYQLKGINTGFAEDGKTLELPDENQKQNPYRTDRYWQIRKTKELLKYAIGKPRYTEELADQDLSKLIFCFGYYDQNVGALSEEEIAFLKAKNAQVLGVETGHYEIWKRVIDAFERGDIKL
ncbi:MAG: hypothetical protein AAF242_08615 [Bacteroidota bacterium]